MLMYVWFIWCTIIIYIFYSILLLHFGDKKITLAGCNRYDFLCFFTNKTETEEYNTSFQQNKEITICLYVSELWSTWAQNGKFRLFAKLIISKEQKSAEHYKMSEPQVERKLSRYYISECIDPSGWNVRFRFGRNFPIPLCPGSCTRQSYQGERGRFSSVRRLSPRGFP